MTSAVPDGFRVARLPAGVTRLVIDRPAKRNALTAAMWAGLPGLLSSIEAGTRVLLLTGADGTFSAGADVDDLLAAYRDPDDARAYHDINVAAEAALAAFPVPTVAVIEGACVGGGCQLAVACDIRIAAPGARFGLTPARLGVVYPAAPATRLAALVGPARAKYLLFTADLIDAATALAFGLVEEVTPDAEERGREIAATIASRSPQSIGAAKAVIDASAGRSAEQRIAPWEAAARQAPDVIEGLTAFRERRPAVFPDPPERPSRQDR